MKEKPFHRLGSNQDVFATQLRSLVLIKIDLKFDKFGRVSFVNKGMEGNLCMCESSIPSMILKIAEELTYDKKGVLLGELQSRVKHDFLNHRLTQLLNNLLYATVAFNHVWNGELNYLKIYTYAPFESDNLVSFSAYKRGELIKLLFTLVNVELKIQGERAQLIFRVTE